MTIYFGAHDLSRYEESRVQLVSSKFIIHPNFTVKIEDGDLALVKLPKELQETDVIKVINISKKDISYEGSEGKNKTNYECECFLIFFCNLCSYEEPR